MKIDKITVRSAFGDTIQGRVDLSRETTDEPVWTINDYQVFTFTSLNEPKARSDLPWYIDSASLSGSYMIHRHTKAISGTEKLLYTAQWISTPAKIPMIPASESISVVAIAMPKSKVKEFVEFVKIHSSLNNKIYELTHRLPACLQYIFCICPCSGQATRSVQPRIIRNNDDITEETCSPKRKNKEITLLKKSASAPSSPTKRQKTGTKRPAPALKTENNDLHARVLDLTARVEKTGKIMACMQEDLKNVKTLKKKRNFSEKIWNLGVNVKKSSDLMGDLKLLMLSQDPEPLRKDLQLVTEIMNMATKIETMQTHYDSLLENMEAVWKQLGDVLLHGGAEEVNKS